MRKGRGPTGSRPFALPRSYGARTTPSASALRADNTNWYYAPLWTLGPPDRGVAGELGWCDDDGLRWGRVHHIHIKVYCDYSLVLAPLAYSPECVE
jgi:hypothetical protein